MLLQRFPKLLQAGRKLRDRMRMLEPGYRKREQAAMQARIDALGYLDRYSRTLSGEDAPRASNVLIDGLWDNPNYWTRYALVRRAFRLAEGRETGVLGEHSREKVRASFSALGITKLFDYRAAAKPSRKHLNAAAALLAEVRNPDDLLKLRLPEQFPATLLYDAILKRQRRAAVDLHDPALPALLADVLAHLDAAEGLISEGRFDLVVLSHSLDYTYAAIAWAAIRRRIPVLTLYGDFGAARFFRLKDAADLFAYPGRPTSEQLEGMSPRIQELLRERGASQMRARVSGQTDDISAVYAYQRRREPVDKQLLAERFGWDPAKPIVGVYNSNWFDYPHALGLHYFRDFLDWIEQTLAVASRHTAVNWLFKAHPCDDWYASINGTRLEDLVAAADLPHVRLADKSWNGLGLIRSLDGIVTCHGTIGMEAAAVGTPVLVSYPGWYGHAGFVVNPGNRDSYLSTLKTEWWKGVEIGTARARAEVFAGWMFCVPDWHGSYILQDDSRQDAIYPGLPAFLEANAGPLEREIGEIRAWYDSGQRYFYVFKIARAEGFQESNRAPGRTG